MTWIDEMFVSMETDSAAAAAKRSANAARVNRTEHLKEQIPAASELWGALVASIKNDVSEFNKHKKRAGQTAVRVSQRGFHCEVYLPGMHGKRMVLTLANNNLQVLVHPDFPKQPLTITVQPDKDSQNGFWVLGDPDKESGKQSVQQLSEYLLKPILASADISRAQ
jgi:hypothetical protein